MKIEIWIDLIVHTVDDLDFDIGGSSGRQLRFVRDTSLPAPSTAMISSISEQVCPWLCFLRLIAFSFVYSSVIHSLVELVVQ